MNKRKKERKKERKKKKNSDKIFVLHPLKAQRGPMNVKVLLKAKEKKNIRSEGQASHHPLAYA